MTTLQIKILLMWRKISFAKITRCKMKFKLPKNQILLCCPTKAPAVPLPLLWAMTRLWHILTLCADIGAASGSTRCCNICYQNCFLFVTHTSVSNVIISKMGLFLWCLLRVHIAVWLLSVWLHSAQAKDQLLLLLGSAQYVLPISASVEIAE